MSDRPACPIRQLSVTTVRGAGHMVPSRRPKQALALIYRAVHQLGWEDVLQNVPGPAISLNVPTACTGGRTCRSKELATTENFQWSVNVGDTMRLEACTGYASDTHECQVSTPGSVPLVFSWSHNGRPLRGAGVAERINGAVDAALVVPAAKPADAGLYEVEINDVLGNLVGSMSVDVHVSLKEACESMGDNVPGDSDGDGCPDTWEGDGVCDQALCPTGDAEDCFDSVSGILCTDYVGFAKQLDAITFECCDQEEEDCSTGLPSICDASCASVLLPAVTACAGFLSGSTTDAAGINGASVLGELNKAAKKCSGGGH
jgi:hypothetical protein